MFSIWWANLTFTKLRHRASELGVEYELNTHRIQLLNLPNGDTQCCSPDGCRGSKAQLASRCGQYMLRSFGHKPRFCEGAAHMPDLYPEMQPARPPESG